MFFSGGADISSVISGKDINTLTSAIHHMPSESVNVRGNVLEMYTKEYEEKRTAEKPDTQELREDFHCLPIAEVQERIEVGKTVIAWNDYPTESQGYLREVEVVELRDDGLYFEYGEDGEVHGTQDMMLVVDIRDE